MRLLFIPTCLVTGINWYNSCYHFKNIIFCLIVIRNSHQNLMIKDQINNTSILKSLDFDLNNL